MMNSPWKDLQLSRMMLGTVQFGLPYGVANRSGQPSYTDVLAIVDAAVQGGVNCFDTAAAYGSSEEVLGRALHELHATDDVTVISKVRALTAAERTDAKAAAEGIRNSVQESRRRLMIDCLPLVLFHREADMMFADVLHELQHAGWLKYFGVSCDNRPGPAVEFVASGRIAALQLPGNILDQRHQQSGVFARAAAAGMGVFIRSVYLQGLLVMAEEDIPWTLQDIIPARRSLQAIAQSAGMPLNELAVRYMLAQQGVTSVLVGVETVDQVDDNIAVFEQGPLPQDLVDAVIAVVPVLPEMLITPSLWPASS